MTTFHRRCSRLFLTRSVPMIVSRRCIVRYSSFLFTFSHSNFQLTFSHSNFQLTFSSHRRSFSSHKRSVLRFVFVQLIPVWVWKDFSLRSWPVDKSDLSL